jgi:hypothetical protein
MNRIYKNVIALASIVLGTFSAANAQITYTQDFETGLNGWSTNWGNTAINACVGQSPRKNIYTTGTAGAFVSPNLGPNTGGAQALSFDYKIINWSGGGATPANFGTIQVQYATAVAGPWITVFVIDQNNHIPSTSCVTITTPEFCAPAGDFFLRFNCTYGSGDYYTYFDDISLSSGTPQCFSPMAVSTTSLEPTEVTLEWIAGCSETAWNFELGTPGFTPGTSTEIFASNPSATTESVTGLTELTVYEVYVQADCGGGDVSSWAGPFSFNTPVNPISTFPYLEDFETGAIAWTIGGTNSSWQIGTPAAPIINTAANGSGAAVTNLTGQYNNSELSYLYSPVFDFSSVTYPVLSFNFARQFENCCDRGWVEYSTNGNTWVKLGTTTSWNSNGYNNASNYWSSDLTTWTETSHNLLMLAGESTVSFRFVMSSDVSVNREGMGVDDFQIVDIPCPDPTNLVLTTFDNESATITWDAGYIETDWNVEIGLSGFTPGTGNAEQSTNVTSTIETFNGLTQITNYEIYVQADCGGGEFSTWVGPVSFTSLPNCSALTNLVATVNAPDEVELAWTPGSTGETEWYVEYGAPGFTMGTGTGSTVTTNPTTTITGLTQNTTYSFYVRGVCSTVDSSLWVGPETVTTPLFCNNVSGLSATTVVDTAFLSWTAGINAETEWNVEYGPVGFTLGTGTQYTTTNNNTDTLIGLTPSATYHFYVQAACASGDTSLFSGPATITMPLGNDDACDAIELPVDGLTRSFSSVGSTSQGLPGENRSVWFYFEHPNSNGVNASLCGSSFDTKIYAYTYTDCNDLTTFTQIAFNDDFCGLQSEIEICGTPGENIAIMVTGFGATTTGNFVINLSEINLNAGTNGSADVCATDMVDLETVATITDANGTWSFNVNPNALDNDSELNLAVLPIGQFTAFYVVSQGCASDTVTATVTSVAAPQSGVAVNPFVTCNTGDVFLLDGLSGTIQSGGTWSDDSGTGLLGGQNSNIFVANGLPVGSYPFTYTVAGGVCPDASTVVNVTLANCVSVEENSLNFSIFPNPNNGTFNLVSNISERTEITITDVQGKIVYNNVVTLAAGIANEVNINNVVPGMYIVKITSNNNVATSTIVVQ